MTSLGQKPASLTCLSSADWRVLGASVIGSSHLGRGQPCQDAHAARELPGGGIALAVADGAGSAARSERGAQLATKSFIAALAARLSSTPSQASDEPDLDRPDREESSQRSADSESSSAIGFDDPAETRDARWPKQACFDLGAVGEAAQLQGGEAESAAGDEVEHIASTETPADTPLASAARAALSDARAALLAEADALAVPARELACTFSAALHRDGELVVLQLGDSLALSRDLAAEWQLIGEPHKGEYEGETLFLSQDSALDELQVLSRRMEPSALVLSSDGLARLMLSMPGRQPHHPFCEPLLRLASKGDAAVAAEALAAFMGSDRVNQRTDDDKTLLIALRPSAAE